MYTALQVVNKGGDLLDAETGGSLQRYTNLTDADTVYASQQANTGDRLELHVIYGRLPTGAEQWWRQSIRSRLRRYRSCSRPFLLDQVAIFLKVANSPKHEC